VWLLEAPPAAARVGVWREGFKEPAYGVARWSAYKGPGPMWQKYGSRDAWPSAPKPWRSGRHFPNELSGLYTREEMGQAYTARG